METIKVMNCTEFMAAIDRLNKHDARQAEVAKRMEKVPAYTGMSDAAWGSMIAPARKKDGTYRA